MKPYAIFWVALGAYVAAVVIFKIVTGRSVRSKICELYLRFTNKHETAEHLRNKLTVLSKEQEPVYSIPPNISFKYPLEYALFEGVPTYTIRGGEKGIVYYLHGGGYVNDPLKYHWRFLDKIAKRTRCTVVVPIYPKAPWHRFVEAYDLLAKQYFSLLETGKKITVMGDSSGGGLALGLCEYFKKQNVALPDQLILIAPWVDITLSNADIPEYQKLDPRNTAEVAGVWGEFWVGDGDPADYRVSPLFGDLHGLGKTHIFVGTHDIMYPDSLLLFRKCKEAGVDCKLTIGKKLDHVYPVYPMPEGAKAVRQISAIIAGRS